MTESSTNLTELNDEQLDAVNGGFLGVALGATLIFAAGTEIYKRFKREELFATEKVAITRAPKR